MPLRGGRGQHGAGICPHREEPGDAGIEHAGEAPLHIEAKRHDRIDAAKGQQRNDVKPNPIHLFHQG